MVDPNMYRFSILVIIILCICSTHSFHSESKTKGFRNLKINETSKTPDKPEAPDNHLDHQHQEGSPATRTTGKNNHHNNSRRSNKSHNETPTFQLTNETHVITIEDHQSTGYITADIVINENKAHNYSVFLVSHNPNHIAIALEVEHIDFELRNSCEFQKLTVSLADITDPKAASSNETSNNAEMSLDSSPNEAFNNETEKCDSSESKYVTFPLFMHDLWLIYNIPPNKTILSPSNDNEFKLANSLVDSIHESTCNELRNLKIASNNNSTSSDQHHERGLSPEGPAFSMVISNSTDPVILLEQSDSDTVARIRPLRPVRPTKRPKSRRNKASRRSKSATGRMNQCDHKSLEYRQIASKKFQDEMSWQTLLEICGPVNKLVVPLRSIKFRIKSDEFAKDATFRLKYRFIEDPNEIDYRQRGEFMCRNRKTIPISLKCDGNDDCGDASDDMSILCNWTKLERENAAELAQISTESKNFDATTRSDIANGTTTDGLKQHQHHQQNHPRQLRFFDKSLLHCCDSKSGWKHLLPAPSVDKVTKIEGHKRSKRIVNGEPVSPGQWPAQVSLQTDHTEPFSHWCGGVLIHPEYVITAAHCITDEYVPYQIKIVVGETNMLKITQNNTQVRYVDDLFVYPGLGWKRLRLLVNWKNDEKNDFAILKLSAPVILSENVMPACLPPVDLAPTVGSNCQIIGWGRTHGSGNVHQLKRINQSVVDPQACILGLGENRFNNHTMLCIKNPTGKSSGICEGDSGGPLYCERVTSSGGICNEVAGLVSSSIEIEALASMCAVAGPLNMYADTSRKMSWITSTMDMFEILHARDERI